KDAAVPERSAEQTIVASVDPIAAVWLRRTGRQVVWGHPTIRHPVGRVENWRRTTRAARYRADYQVGAAGPDRIHQVHRVTSSGSRHSIGHIGRLHGEGCATTRVL